MNGKKYSSPSFSKLNSMEFFLLLWYSILISIRGELTSIIQTDKGQIQGEILTTVVNGFPYSSFRGIPYGKPPIETLRFKPPEEADSWNGIFLATSEGNQCPQIHYTLRKYNGNEDCLYINVYTPKTNFKEKSKKLLPVMVWFFGGKFKFGQANATAYGPDFLIEEGVIMVAMNFRLGALGYLALDIPEATGNAALKDQVLALKWVKKNIINFGGDPNAITIFGISSGASSVDLHLLSDASRGLFHRSISLSGTPINPWGFSTPEQARNRAIRLANLLGIETTNSSREKIFQELSKRSAEELVTMTENLTEDGDREFKPTIENFKIAGKTAFLTECPVAKFKSGDFARLPHMTGFVANEILAFATSVKSLIDQTKFALNSMNRVLHNKVGKFLSEFLENLSKNSNGNLSEFPETFIMAGINILSDVLTIAGIDTKQQLMAKYSSVPVYYYRNSFDVGPESLHRTRFHINLSGVAHADDMPNIFYQPTLNPILDLNGPQAIIRQRTVRLFANFAKYGNPTPDGSLDPVLNITWPISGKEGIHLEIGETMKVGGRPINDNVKIIEQAQKNGILEEINGCKQKDFSSAHWNSESTTKQYQWTGSNFVNTETCPAKI